MAPWMTLVSNPHHIEPAQREQLTLLNEVLPIPDGSSTVTRLFSWVTAGVKEGLLTEREGRDLKFLLGNAV